MLSNYFSELKSAITTVELESVGAIKAAVEAIKKSNVVFVGGNGGSAAIAEHWACDIQKLCRKPVHSLVSNSALITATANDLGYENVFRDQLSAWGKYLNNSVIIMVSSSGSDIKDFKTTSENVKQVGYLRDTLRYLDINTTLIGFTGFKGGYLKEKSDICIHVPVNDYGIVEDCHQACMHAISRELRK